MAMLGQLAACSVSPSSMPIQAVGAWLQCPMQRSQDLLMPRPRQEWDSRVVNDRVHV